MPPDPAQFYSTTRAARKIIVVDLGFLGDTVHLIPALWEIKRNYPEARLDVLTTPVGAGVLGLVSCVDRAWAQDLKRENRTLNRQWELVRALRRERFDLAFNFSGADRTIFMTALTGARWRVAHPGGRHHFWNSWLIRYWIPWQNLDQIVFEQRRQMLSACGMPLHSPRFDLRIGEAEQAWAAELVPPYAIHLSLNSAKATREWPVEHHVKMIRLVWAKHPEVIVLASGTSQPRERHRLSELAVQLNDKRLQVLPETLTIAKLAAVLQRSRLHIGPDSGVLHLAVALEVPTVSFFRQQGAYKSFMPRGPQHQVISMPCFCIDHLLAPCQKLGRAKCFAAIEPQRVADLVLEAL